MAMAQIEFDISAGCVRFSETARGRLIAAFARFVVAFIGGALVLGVFLLPDYIGRYAQDEPITGLFVVALLGLAALFGLSLGVARAARKERWTLDPKHESLYVERSSFGRPGMEEAIDLQYVTALSIMRRTAPRTSTLEVVFEDGQTLVLLRAPAMDDSWEELATALEKFAQVRPMGVEIRRA